MGAVVFAGLGLPGHCFPLVPLARACADADHDVSLATAGSMRDQLEPAGVRLTEAGMEVRDAFAESIRRIPSVDGADVRAERVELAFVDLLATAFARDVSVLLREREVDLVIAESSCPGALLAAAEAGVPSVCHGVGLRPDGVSYPLAVIEGRFAQLLAEHGIEAPPAGGSLAAAYLDHCPPSLGPAATAGAPAPIAIRPVPWAAAGAPRPRRPSVSRPWVFVTFGSIVDAPETMATVLGGLAQFDVDVLVAAGNTDVTGLSASSSVQVEAWVDQAAVLAQADLVVHHGGSGTMLAAAALGVPQLLVPAAADQHLNAAAIEAIGAGRALADLGDDRGLVTAAAQALLSGELTRDVARLRREIAAMPSPSSVVSELESRWLGQESR